MSRAFRVAALLLGVALLADDAPVELTGQILAYQQGYVFFTTGDAFRIAPDAPIFDDKTKSATTLRPGPRIFARAVFDQTGTITTLYVTRSALPIEPIPPQIEQFAIASSPKVPNPELGGPPLTANGVPITYSGKPVVVRIVVQVPTTTPPTAILYISTDQSGWNPQAIHMDRVDALHFQVLRKINSGTVLHYFYTRGSLQSEELAKNGLTVTPRRLTVNDADAQSVSDTVYGWADTTSGGQSAQPNALPTPYNPAPFPNLPGGYPTPHPLL